MKKTVLTIELMQKRMETAGERVLPTLFRKYFDGKKVGDEDRPSQEVSEWFFKNLSESYGYSGEMFDFLEQGYITFSRIVEIGHPEFLTRSSRGFMHMFSVEGCMPIVAGEMEQCFDKIPRIMKEVIAKGILTLNVQMMNCEAFELRMKKNFIATLEGCFSELISHIDVNDRIAWMWRNCTHIPTRVIKREFNQAVGFQAAFEKVGGRFQEHVGRFYIPIEQTLELVPFLASLPQAGRNFPYCKNIGAELLIEALDQACEDLARCESKQRLQIYNMFIKPLRANPSLFTILFDGRNYKTSIKGLARIGAAVVPASELVSFVRDTLLPLFEKERETFACLELVANVKTRANQPVTKEFIIMQLEYGIRGSYLCLNNSCINNLNFWLTMSETCHQVPVIFQHGLQHNESFKNWFKFDVEDLEFYKENRRNISWSSFYNLPIIPKEFIREFNNYLPISRLSNETLASFGEEEISQYLEGSDSRGIPSNLLEVNHNMSIPFMAKHLPQLFTNRRSVEYCGHLKLSDMVAALE